MAITVKLVICLLGLSFLIHTRRYQQLGQALILSEAKSGFFRIGDDASTNNILCVVELCRYPFLLFYKLLSFGCFLPIVCDNYWPRASSTHNSLGTVDIDCRPYLTKTKQLYNEYLKDFHRFVRRAQRTKNQEFTTNLMPAHRETQ